MTGLYRRAKQQAPKENKQDNSPPMEFYNLQDHFVQFVDASTRDFKVDGIQGSKEPKTFFEEFMYMSKLVSDSNKDDVFVRNYKLAAKALALCAARFITPNPMMDEKIQAQARTETQKVLTAMDMQDLAPAQILLRRVLEDALAYDKILQKTHPTLKHEQGSGKVPRYGS